MNGLYHTIPFIEVFNGIDRDLMMVFDGILMG
jgi:hypothetical protein